MPETESLLIFLGATLALNVTPGPDMLYVIARSTAEGTRAGVVSAFGIAAGTLVHLAAVALGLAALLEAVPLAYEVVRYAGAAFLIAVAFAVFQIWTAAYGSLPSQVVRATSSTSTAALVAASALGPRVNTPWFFNSRPSCWLR